MISVSQEKILKFLINLQNIKILIKRKESYSDYNSNFPTIVLFKRWSNKNLKRTEYFDILKNTKCLILKSKTQSSSKVNGRKQL